MLKEKRQIIICLGIIFFALSMDLSGVIKYNVNRFAYRVINAEIIEKDTSGREMCTIYFQYKIIDGKVIKDKTEGNIWEEVGDTITVAIPINEKTLRRPIRLTYMLDIMRITCEVIMTIKIISLIIEIKQYKN